MSQYIGKWPLGYVEIGSNEDGYLGSVHSITVDEIVAGSNLLQNINPNEVVLKWVKNTGSTTLVPGAVVKSDITEDMAWAVEEIVAGQRGCGIVDPRLTANVPVGAKFNIVTKGITDVKVDAVYATKGISLGVGVAGLVTTNAVATVADLKHVFGVLHEASTAIGQLVKAEVNFTVCN